MASKRRAARGSDAPLPAVFVPQLATLVDEPPGGDEWLHEIKYDGYRIGCRIDGGEVQLWSRNGKDWTGSFPPVRDAAARLGVRRALLDGEVAVVLPDGRTSFQALQNVFRDGRTAGLTYFVFDLLHLDGEDVGALLLEQRKARLARLVGSDDIIRYSDHVVGNARAVLGEACRRGLEGIVSKLRDASYQPGRSRAWRKTKCVKQQEFVIGGFTDPEGSRSGIGALLLGVRNQRGGLEFAGKVGTGFTHRVALDLRSKLDRLEQRTSPFETVPPGPLGRLAHWVRPSLVADIAFGEWTEDGKLRHGSFRGLRPDKSSAEVVRERPAASDANEVAGVRLSHPDRVLWPDTGLTKLGLARFYEGIADWIVPHVKGRPLTLVRCPDGIAGKCFYMKHSKVWAPPVLRRVRIKEKKKLGEYLIADSLEAVIGLVQMDVLEIHTWNTKADDVERPDRIVLDLDPGPDVRWAQVVEAARLVRSVLQAVGLASFVKTTGGHGLHVVVPLVPERRWDECLAFSRTLAEVLVRQHPRRYTTAYAKAGRERQILIDYLRNNRTNTSVSAFSTRARAGAPVSMPIAWDELGGRLRPNAFTVRNAAGRLRALRDDPWKAYWKTRQRIDARVLEALSAV